MGGLKKYIKIYLNPLYEYKFNIYLNLHCFVYLKKFYLNLIELKNLILFLNFLCPFLIVEFLFYMKLSQKDRLFIF